MSELQQESVDLVLTDPPYAINYRSNRRVANPKFDHIKNDMPGNWIERFAIESYRLLKNNRHLYCFCRHDTYPLFYKAFEEAGFKLKRTLIWVKDNHGSGDLKGDYAPRDEWIIFAHKGRRILNGKRNDNILEYPKVHTSKLLHPTQKPVELLRFLIGKSTEKDEIILDPYGGVLSTAVAAMQEERSFIMIDMEVEFITKGMLRLEEQDNRKEFLLENNNFSLGS
ncbi:MAG: site-specific DNA-methyltransferase [Calditrichaeota bacterium]|nr:site-specific DNA-methyltransferase [Calditrichota bacterium]